MTKEFNVTGICNPQRHYMVDTTNKLNEIKKLVEKGHYFTINGPRQFGKTTSLVLLAKILRQEDECFVIKTSFEGVGDALFNNEAIFSQTFVEILADEIEFGDQELADFLYAEMAKVDSLKKLSRLITKLVRKIDKQVILMIDEIDKSSNNQIFISFLAMLRDKYLKRDKGTDITFHSVILAGVHDVKTLKIKIRPDSERKYNSPWNIAADFNVDLRFNPAEISTMLSGYALDKHIDLDQKAISEKLHYYTSGHPFLVSKLCKIIDEEINVEQTATEWTVAKVDEAFRWLVREDYTTTNFDDMIKNLENNEELYEVVFKIVINGETIRFNIGNPVLNLGYLYGILAKSEMGCAINNRIYEQRIYSYMLSKQETSGNNVIGAVFSQDYITGNNLNIELILKKYQAFMKENYSNKDVKFLEREGRLLFLSFLRPIINGLGFDFKEPAVAAERRIDVVITFKNKRYVIELKRWYGQAAHKKGLKQLSDYLDTYSLKEGYLLIYDFNKNKKYKEETIAFADKKIFAVWV